MRTVIPVTVVDNDGDSIESFIVVDTTKFENCAGCNDDVRVSIEDDEDGVHYCLVCLAAEFGDNAKYNPR